jgi:hypothetical protein
MVPADDAAPTGLEFVLWLWFYKYVAPDGAGSPHTNSLGNHTNGLGKQSNGLGHDTNGLGIHVYALFILYFGLGSHAYALFVLGFRLGAHVYALCVLSFGLGIHTYAFLVLYFDLGEHVYALLVLSFGVGGLSEGGIGLVKAVGGGLSAQREAGRLGHAKSSSHPIRSAL